MAVCLRSGCQGNEPLAAEAQLSISASSQPSQKQLRMYETVIATIQQTECLSFYVNVSNSQNSFLSIRHKCLKSKHSSH